MRIRIIYYNSKYIIEPSDDNITSCLKLFSDLIKIDLNNLTFIYKGKELDQSKSLEEYKVKVLILLAYNLKKITHDKDTNDILCPGCNNPGIINIENDEVNITKCINNHINFDIPFKEFINMKNELNKEEKCGVCGNSENLYGMPLDICSCGKNICPLCLLLHDPAHKSINYYERLYICSKHAHPFISYCIQCNMNLCEKCEPTHAIHKPINKKATIPSDSEINKIKSNAKEVIKYCELLKDEFNRIQMILNKVINFYMKNLEGFAILNKNVLEWVKDMKNYETIKNIININEYNKIYKKTLTEIFNYSFNDKVRFLLKFYEEKRKELTIYYKNPNKNNFNIFNNSFVENNKNNCYIKIRNEKKELTENYLYNEKNNEKKLPKIKIKLVREKKMNLKRMFQNCQHLLSFDEDEFSFTSIFDEIIYLFSGCENLINLPDLSVINVSNIKDFSNIFYRCSSLTSLPDISKWNTSQAKVMKGLFKECKNLLYLPDISKWNTSNVVTMDEMFSGCVSLISLPDISIWNTSHLKSLNEMFSGCKSLTSFPELSAWNTSNVTDMIGTFTDCDVAITPELIISSGLENESSLKSINYHQLWTKIYCDNDQNINYNKFCEAFLIFSLNKKESLKFKPVSLSDQISEEKIEQGNYLQKNKPEIIFKYPLDINEKFDLEDLAYSCFSMGISAYVEQIPPEQKCFMFSFRNINKEKFYLLNYFTYKKIPLVQYYSEYREKDNNNEKEESETISTEIKVDNPKGFAYVPFCFCLISKYFYVNQLQNCLKSIYSLFCRIKGENDYLVLRDLILFLINSIPIPPINKQISFTIPCLYESIKLDCPIYKGYHLLNTNFYPVFRSFNIGNNSPNKFSIIFPLRILLNEKSLIILDKNENRLTKFCDAFLSLLYPFEWIYTYIPILNEKNIKKIDLNAPFLIGTSLAMIDKIEKLLEQVKLKDNVYLLYVYDGYTDFDLGSSLTCPNSYINFDEHLKKNITDFPDTELYWGLVKIMKDKSALTLKLYSNEAKIINREFQKVLMHHFAEFILYIEKTKEKKRKTFYSHLSKTKLYDNYIKNQYDESVKFFQEFLNTKRKDKKAKLNYDFNIIKEKYLINPVFSSIKEKFENIKDLQKFIREIYPEDKITERIFENDIELKEKDFQINNDKIYLFNE